MKNNILAFVGLALAVFTLTACPSNEVMESKNIAQSEIHQQYYITYDQNDKMMTVIAVFRAAGPNGTTIVLSEPSDVICNGTEMKLATYILGGAHYIHSLEASPLPSDVKIEFIDLDKKIYNNLFKIHAITVDKKQNGFINVLRKGSTNYITLKTHALEQGESMWLDIEGDSSFVRINIDGNEIPIGKESLDEFRPKEKVSLQITRERTGSVTQATPRGGRYTVTSRSVKWTATVK